MSMFGQVYVKNNQYKIKGDFHELTPNMPIRNADDGWKLMAARCDNPKCEYKGTIWQPFRTICPDCLKKMTAIDLTDVAKKTAKVHTFMVCERSGAFSLLDKPIKFINVEFDGVCTILMSYLAVGDPAFGMKVVPCFKKQDPTFTILDLCFVPEGTKAEQLPRGFSF